MIFVSGESNVTFHYTYFAITANMLIIITGILVNNVQHSTLWIPLLVGLIKTSKLIIIFGTTVYSFFYSKAVCNSIKKIPKVYNLHKVSDS